MSRGSRRLEGRQDLPLNAEINVTSLVDVAFTLLVIFIITAPILQGGVEVSVPRADVEALTTDDQPFIVAIHPNGQILVSETEVSPEEFAGVLSQMVRARGVERVYIRGDSTANYGDALRVIAAVAKQEGITFALVAEPDRSR